MNLRKKICCLLFAAVCLVLCCFALASCEEECAHSAYGEWREVKAATCYETGLKERNCLDCGQTFSQTINTKAHKYGDYKGDNNESCTFIGSSTATCTVCGATTKKMNDGNHYGHTYFDGVCSACSDTITLIDEFDASLTEADKVTVKIYKSLDGYYKLDVTGVGAMKNYTDESPAPWNKYASNVTTIHFYEGVTRIGQGAFTGLPIISEVLVEKGLQSIGKGAFTPTFSPDITYVFDMPTWVSIDFEDEGVPSLYTTTLIYVGEITLKNDKKVVMNKSTTISDLVLPEGVTKINAYSFYNCAHLTTIEIPASLTEIGEYAFYGCSRLDEVHISNLEAWCKIDFGGTAANPLSIGKRLWISGELCESLDLTGITEISPGAFEGASTILSVTLDPSLKSIPAAAFYGCSGISSVVIPEGIESIGDYSFYGCKSLRTVTLPDTVTTLGTDVFRDCLKLTTVDLGDGANAITDSLFAGCRELLHLEIGANVASISANAFIGCNKIVEIYNRSSLDLSEYEFASGALSVYTEYKDSAITEIVDETDDGIADKGVGILYYTDGDIRYILSYVGKSETLVIPADILGAGYEFYDYSFYNSHIKKLTIEGTPKAFGEAAFLGTSLTFVRIKDLTAWCAAEFVDQRSNPIYYAADVYIADENDALTALKIPEGIQSVGKYAFAGAVNISSLTLPDSLTFMGEGAFHGCNKIIKLSSNVYYVGKWVVDIDRTKNSYVFLADTVGFANGVFEGVTLTSVSAPARIIALIPKDGVKSITVSSGDIPERAFEGFLDLESVSINSSIKTVDENAFVGCAATAVSVAKEHLTKLVAENITSLTITSGTIRRDDLLPFTALKSFTLTSGVSSIEADLLKGHKTLEAVYIKGGITKIPESAFEGCKNLSTVSIYTGLNAIEKNAFASTPAIKYSEGAGYVDSWLVAVEGGIDSVVVKKETVGFADGVFAQGTAIKTVYFLERLAMWNNIKKNSGKNDAINSINIYFYREVKPYQSGNFWHYVDGVPTAWPPLV